LQIKTKIVSYHTADSKPVKREVNSTLIFPPLVFPGKTDEKKFLRRRNEEGRFRRLVGIDGTVEQETGLRHPTPERRIPGGKTDFKLS
jgi:hypothetical protein